MRYSNGIKLLVFILAVSPMAARAFIPCLHNEFAREIPDLVEKVRMYGDGDETRKELNVAAKEFGFSTDEVKLLRQSVGMLYCSAEGRNRQSLGTAFVVGDSQEIITAAHVVTGDYGPRDLTKCYFENFEDPPKKEYLKASSSRNVLPQRRPTDGEDDRARLTLANPIKSIRKPLKVASEGLVANAKSVLLSAQNADIVGTGKYPLAVSCPPTDVVGGRIYSCCNTDGGGSGGVHIGRDSKGELVAQAVHVSQTSRVKDGRIPDKTPCSYFNNNLSLSLDGF